MFLPPNILSRGMKYQLRKQLCSFENERPISFSYTIWFMISEKRITRFTFLHRGACMHQKSERAIQKILSALKLPLCGQAIFTDMNTYRLIEGCRGFETSLRENYASALDSCFLFSKKCET